jgi:cold shock CspA family protein
MRLNGTTKSWDDERGFGFIAPDQGGQDIFVHIKSFEGLRERPKAGQRISFQVQLNTQGKARAINVALGHFA